MVNEKSLVVRHVLKNVLNFDLTKLQQKYLNINYLPAGIRSSLYLWRARRPGKRPQNELQNKHFLIGCPLNYCDTDLKL